MMFPNEHFDAPTLDLMSFAFDHRLGGSGLALVSKHADPTAIRRVMAARIMEAVCGGERDRGRLKQLALEAIKGTIG